MDAELETQWLAQIETVIKRWAKAQDVHVPRVGELARVIYDEVQVPATQRVMEKMEERQ